MDSVQLDIGQSLQAASGRWYRNLQVLGAGGNAVTFLVVATSGPQRGVLFALKVFRRLSKPERREAFLAEINFLKKCDHSSVMRIFDAGIFHQKHPFFLAEYLPNTLFTVIKSRQSSVVLRISFTLQLISALAYLESLETPVVHRDIKPQNIFVKGHSCVLGDFGLIKHVAAENELDRQVFKESIGAGMPFRYRTPDQVAYLNDGTPLTTRSDVFQLGLVLAELFTGQNPQRSSTDFSSDVQLRPLRRIPGSMAGQIENLINRMLNFDVAARDGAQQLLTAWEGIFKAAADQAHAIEGRALW